ncbi:PP2C family protein-serine/threonine phosphatase [Paraburkholderia terricola]|uniref:Protein phosphatase n=1 Tax=Paraburkholderia terricola TaxID=169427 RepID=A0ABU1LTY6_9BURK|nr:protein phosphatase 2C domain-containing protein [Paraburkholderia terricola]MDR6410200.1 protein phosphatase [Paraburkholderia terricola]MDR6481360.1 protein phosphatase [Paraburkholderia terricola]
MTCASQFRWTSSARSDAGRIREINEDACLDQPELGRWAVADGMGGHAVGDLASRLVIDSLSRLAPPLSMKSFVADARTRLQKANRQLREEAARRQVQRIGSTVVVLLACDRFCAYVWAGDSRLYLYREGRLRQLTRDHSQVEALKSLGVITDEEARHHPAQHMITRAVGATDLLELDDDVIEVADGDVFLLCSDGLSNEVSDDEMLAVLTAAACENACEELVDLALARGGRDNITAVVVRAEDPYASDKTLLNPAP